MRLDPGTVIVAPTTFEFNAIRNGLKRLSKVDNYILMKCGVGEQQSIAFCAKLEQLAVKRLVLVGWGGGLTAGLNAGDVLCASMALHADKQPVTCALPTGGKIRAGPILTSAKALLIPTEKRFANETGALAVEMEAYPLAVWAAQHSIPFLHGRVILDTWDETLPDLSLNASGGVRPLELLKLVAKRPAVLGELARLNRRVQMLDPLLAKLAFDLIVD